MNLQLQRIYSQSCLAPYGDPPKRLINGTHRLGGDAAPTQESRLEIGQP